MVSNKQLRNGMRGLAIFLSLIIIREENLTRLFTKISKLYYSYEKVYVDDIILGVLMVTYVKNLYQLCRRI